APSPEWFQRASQAAIRVPLSRVTIPGIRKFLLPPVPGAKGWPSVVPLLGLVEMLTARALTGNVEANKLNELARKFE
ncbi:MAG: hypothetical protein IIX02_01830, partial [Clostridia bacterium]|nr:hypothetical protein [Clostridia bacterium]